MLRSWPLHKCILIAATVLLAAHAGAAEFYVSPNGTSTGDGSMANPWNLATALLQPKTVKAMDTIWLRAGTYKGVFTSNLKGAINAPIVVRAYPGERVILDGAGFDPQNVLTINGSWTWYWGLEIVNSDPNRWTDISGSNTPGSRGTGVYVMGDHVKFINGIVHDTGVGFGFWTPAVESELYGNLIYNNGWGAPDRAHGHNIYTQNDTGIKLIGDNVLFNPFSLNLQLYGSSAATLRNYRLTGNVSFNGRFLIGGDAPAENIELVENLLYGDTAQLYYTNQQNKNLTLTRNYLPVATQASWWDKVTASGNTFFRPGNTGAAVGIKLSAGATISALSFDQNTYLSNGQNLSQVTIQDSTGTQTQNDTFAAWRALGFDLHGQEIVYPNRTPNVPVIFVRRNEYEPTRGHIVIYNWPKLDAVDVDISAMNPVPGDKWELRNAENYFAESISGTYSGGKLHVLMKGWTIAMPTGLTAPLKPATFPDFGVFVLTLTHGKKVKTVNAASLTSSVAAPGSIVSLFAEGVATGVASAPAPPLPNQLLSTTVQVKDSTGSIRPAPLLAVTPSQVNFLLPDQLATGPVTVLVQNGSTTISADDLTLQPAAPGIFTANGDGKGVPAAQAVFNTADGSQSILPVFRCDPGPGACQPAPIDVQSSPEAGVLVLYGTGISWYNQKSAILATVAGQPADVLYAGPQGTFPGLDQVNVRLPRSLAGKGLIDVAVAIENQVSNTVTLAIQ